MLAQQVSRLRSFNRTVTRTIGALQESYLERGRPLAESRLLFEIGEEGAEVSELRARLDLDSGYLSRLLRSLERQGLVITGPAPRDRRVRYARLTRAGVGEWRTLDRRSDQLAASILNSLTPSQRSRMVAAMSEVERLLSAATVRIDEVPPEDREAQYCLSRYFTELAERFGGFDAGLSAAPSLDEFVPPHGTFLVMHADGKPVGCGGFKPMGSDAVYLKRMWIDPDARGLGLGRKLLAALEDQARRVGRKTVRLETHETLDEAQQLYRRSGYREVPPFNDEVYAHHWFEKRL